MILFAVENLQPYKENKTNKNEEALSTILTPLPDFRKGEFSSFWNKPTFTYGSLVT